jgi:GTPase SAR1 family protein
LVVGPSGAGKTSLCLALATTTASRYYAHEMVFVDRTARLIGWPQPFTLNAGSLGWLERARPEMAQLLWIERSVTPDLKSRVGLLQSPFDPSLPQPDLIIFPRRTANPGGDRIEPVSSQVAFTKLVREVEHPITHEYSPVEDLEAYAIESVRVASTLSNSPAYVLRWHDNQDVSKQLIDELFGVAA